MRKVCQPIRRGFTLIELLVVVAVIIILVSVVLISLSGGREKAKVARFKNVVHSLQTAAINVCADAPINWATSFGTIPTPIYSILDNVPSDCGPSAATTFNASVLSKDLATPCTAVIDQTGITNFTGC